MAVPQFNQPVQAPAEILLTVVICTRNRLEFLKTAVSTVLSQLLPNVDLLIVDNASTDKTGEFGQQLSKCDPRVFYHCEKQLGLSFARNTSLQLARGKFVLFFDDDAKGQPGWIKSYVDFLSSLPNPKVACIGGAVYPDFEEPPPSWLAPRWGTLDEGEDIHELKTGYGPWGCNVAYNKAAVLSIGAFNTNLGRKGKFAGAFEESDMNARLRDAGWQIWWIPKASILHYTPARRLKFKVLCRDFFDSGRSKATMRLAAIPSLFQRTAYRCGRLLVQPPQAVFTALSAAVVILFGRRRKAAMLVLKSARSIGFGFQLLQF